MKKILLISNMYPSEKAPFYGTFVKNAHKCLTDGGNKVDLITLENRAGFFNKINSYFFFYINILFSIVNSDCKYVYVHYISHCALPVVIASYFRSINIVSHVHGGDVKYHKGRSKLFFTLKSWLSKRLLNRSYKVVVPSIYYKEYITRNFGHFDTVIYPSGGVDTSVFFSKRKELSTVTKIGYAGRLEATKRVDLIISIFSKLVVNFPYLTLQIVGNGSKQNQIRSLVQDYGLESKVSFLKAKSQSDLADWYRDIDLLIYPSESESLGLVPLEAMACGTIPFLSDIPAFREFIDGKNGFICTSVDDFVASISKLLIMESTEINKVSKYSSAYIDRKYSSQIVSKRLLDVFEE